jgi:hypothetical protein
VSVDLQGWILALVAFAGSGLALGFVAGLVRLVGPKK